MKKIAGKWLTQVAILCSTLFYATCAWSADNYRVVETEQLLRNPKHYWSLGVIFKDTLTALPDQNERELQISRKYYIPFGTKIVGTCYATKDVVTDINKALLNRDYLLKGTVLNRKNEFYVIVDGITPAVEGIGNLDEELFAKPDPQQPEESTLDQLLAEINEKLYAYAEEQNIAIEALLKKDSSHYNNVLNIIQSNIMATEREKKTTSTIILGDLIHDLFVEHYIEPSEATTATTPQQVAIEAEKQAAKNAALRKKAATIMLKPGLRRDIATPDDKDGPSEQPAPAAKPKPMLMEGVPGH